MVDFNLEIEKVRPINITELELERYRIDNNIRKSIILYNAAIGGMKKGSLDLVIGDLKKALSYNKDLTEAIKLMGLCYVSMNEYKKAEKTFKILNKYSMYNELVNEYMQSLSIKKSISKNISNTKNKQASVKKHLRKNIVISLLIVIIAITVVSINYFYPRTMQGVLTKFKIRAQGIQQKFHTNSKTADFKEEADINSDKDEVVLDKNTVSKEENENAQKNLEDSKLETENDKNNTVSMLNDAENFLNGGRYEKAVNILISMKSKSFDDKTKIKFDELWQRLKPNPLWTIYNEGNKLYKEKKYAEALPKLIIVSEIDAKLDIMPWITFQIGTCYKETNDNANALIYFNKVKDNYPNSKYASNARMMISQVGN